MLHNTRVISFVRTAYNNYVNSVLAASNKKVLDAHAAVKKAQVEQQAVYAALFSADKK